MDNVYTKGDLLQIFTKDSEKFEGRFYNITKDKSRISLYNVKDSLEGYLNEGVYHYYNSEITDIVKLQGCNEDSYLKITEKECKEIIKISKKFIFINQVDVQFHEALKDMNTYNYVAVSNDGASMGRRYAMPFLVMSTPHQIYIFDIQVMQYRAFNAGLRKILENESPKKIVHDCRKLSDCLYNKHNVKLTSVFDTQVGDIIVRKYKTGNFPKSAKTLSECLNTYLGLKINADEKLDMTECKNRPMTKALKETLATNIAYLHRLSEVINDQMLHPFVRGVEYYIDCIRSTDDLQAWEMCGKLQKLPKEFKTAIEY